jgi:DNA-binding Xre family transcriptional regulator
MSSACAGPGRACLECGARATYKREETLRIRLYGLGREGLRERLIHDHTPCVSVAYLCPVCVSAQSEQLSIGDRIRLIRTLKRLTQVESAQRLGVSQGDISQIEHNTWRISVRRLASIAEALGCRPGDLLGE